MICVALYKNIALYVLFLRKKVWFWIVLAAIKCSTYRAKRPSFVAIAHHLFPSFCARLELTRTFIKNLFRKFFHRGRISSVGGALDRLQNSLFFCVFKYAWAVKQNVWNEAENSLSPDTLVGRSRLASFARKSLTQRFTDFFTDFEEKTTVLQSTRLTADRKVSCSIPKANTKGLKITENKGAAYLPCKQLDLCVARMTTWGGGPISSSLREET